MCIIYALDNAEKSFESPKDVLIPRTMDIIGHDDQPEGNETTGHIQPILHESF